MLDLGNCHEPKELVESISIFGGPQSHARRAAQQPSSRAGVDCISDLSGARDRLAPSHGLAPVFIANPGRILLTATIFLTS